MTEHDKKSEHDKKVDVGAKAPPDKPPPDNGPEEYVTKVGDTLAIVAQMYYGGIGSQEDRLPIYAANKEVIGDNMNALLPGLTLTIPPPDQKWPIGVNRD